MENACVGRFLQTLHLSAGIQRGEGCASSSGNLGFCTGCTSGQATCSLLCTVPALQAFEHDLAHDCDLRTNGTALPALQIQQIVSTPVRSQRTFTQWGVAAHCWGRISTSDRVEPACITLQRRAADSATGPQESCIDRSELVRKQHAQQSASSTFRRWVLGLRR